VFALSRESTRAGRIPCKCIRAGSIQTSEGECFPLSKSSLPMATCLHPGPTVIFSVVLTSYDLSHWVVASGRSFAEGCSSKYGSSRRIGRELRQAVFRKKQWVVCTSAQSHWAHEAPYWRRYAISYLSLCWFRHQFHRRSVPRTAASVGSEQTKKEWWNLRPSNKWNGLPSLCIEVSPVTPNGFIAVSRISLLELPG
jgi:hypothetical protein